jgi:signal transduction histidine kinase
MRIALMNVLHNALKFSPEDCRITITFVQLLASSLRMTIQDEGPGIAPGEHVKVFDRFFTSSGLAATTTSGLGLGLSIAKLIVERAGGSIRFDEKFHQGAKCLIDLPLEC